MEVFFLILQIQCKSCVPSLYIRGNRDQYIYFCGLIFSHISQSRLQAQSGSFLEERFELQELDFGI